MFFSGMISVGHIRSNWNYISGNSCTIKAILAKMWARSFLQCCKYPVLVCSIMEEVDIVDSPCVTTLPIQVGVFKLTHKSVKPQVSNGFPAQIMIANTIIMMSITDYYSSYMNCNLLLVDLKLFQGEPFLHLSFPDSFILKVWSFEEDKINAQGQRFTEKLSWVSIPL